MAIRLGRALAGLKPLPVRTANQVYRGEVLFEDGEIHRGFLKDLDPRQFANELLVATLGRQLGVQVAEAAIVFVASTISGDFRKIPHSGGHGHVVLFSKDVGPQTVAQMITTGVGEAMQSLKKPPNLGYMYGLDTWVANVDRHANNIVLSGAGETCLIDHGHCFTGPQWDRADLNSADAYKNRLTSWLTPRLEDSDKDRALADIQRLIRGMMTADIEELVRAAAVRELYGEEDSDALVGFLEGRVANVEALAASALGKLL